MAIASATVVYNKYGHVADMTVLANGHRYVVRPNYSNQGAGAPSNKIQLRNIQITAVGTHLLQGDGRLIADATALSKQVFPKTPEQYTQPGLLRSKGGILLGDDRVLWIFSWDDILTMSEPSGETFAVELWKGDNNQIKAGRVAPLKGLSSHIVFRGVVTYGMTLAMVTYGISLFDTIGWEEKQALTDGDPCVGGTNRVYWSSQGNIYRYDPDSGKFVLKGNPDLGYLTDSYTVGGEDVLVFQNGLYTPDAHGLYVFPGPRGYQLAFYPIGDVALGFVSPAFPAGSPGILLAPHSLQPLTMVTASKPN